MEIALDQTGHGSPIVLLHGVGANRKIWRHVTARLASRRTVLAPDIPGFGSSPAVGKGFRLEETADALAAELDRRLGERFDLVGNSLGGAVALVLAARRPDLIRRLVLSAPAGLSPTPAPVTAAMRYLAGPVTRARTIVGTRLVHNPTARRALLFGTVAAPQRLPADEARELLSASRGSTRIGAGIAAVMRADLRPALAGLDVPVGFIWGDRDRIVPISTLKSVRNLRPDAEIMTLKGVAHVPQIEAPEQFVTVLRYLLSQLDGRTSSTL